MAINRGVLLIEHAAAKYSASGESKRLVTEFLLRILKGDGVARQSINPLWDTGLDSMHRAGVPSPGRDIVERQTHPAEAANLARKMTAAANIPLSARGMNPLHM